MHPIRLGRNCALIGGLALAWLFHAPPVSAQAEVAMLKAMVDEMRGQMAAMQQRIDRLEATSGAPVNSEHVALAGGSNDPTDRFELTGDLRYRFDGEDDDAREDVRDRHRIRATRCQRYQQCQESQLHCHVVLPAPHLFSLRCNNRASPVFQRLGATRPYECQ